MVSLSDESFMKSKSLRKSFFAFAPWVIAAISLYSLYEHRQRRALRKKVEKERAIEKQAVNELQKRGGSIFINYTRPPQPRVKSVKCPVMGERINGKWVINEPGLTDEDMKHLAVLTQLQELELFGSTFTDTGLQHLSRLTNLKNLSITRDPRITDAGIEFLKGLASLKTLSLSGTSVTEEGVAGLQAALPDCAITFGKTEEPMDVHH